MTLAKNITHVSNFIMHQSLHFCAMTFNYDYIWMVEILLFVFVKSYMLHVIVTITRDKTDFLEIIIIRCLHYIARAHIIAIHTRMNFRLFADNYILTESITIISRNNSIGFLSSQLSLSLLITSSLLSCLRFVLVLLRANISRPR